MSPSHETRTQTQPQPQPLTTDLPASNSNRSNQDVEDETLTNPHHPNPAEDGPQRPDPTTLARHYLFQIQTLTRKNARLARRIARLEAERERVMLGREAPRIVRRHISHSKLRTAKAVSHPRGVSGGSKDRKLTASPSASPLTAPSVYVVGVVRRGMCGCWGGMGGERRRCELDEEE
ncbi:hypothetical protein DENSPDRAFT_853963 [Dentipellis sp. KUC8613]|nr:hypothetical protein DENSPDRAFT_853963 [Dentipellis sp. KUC8613]